MGLELGTRGTVRRGFGRCASCDFYVLESPWSPFEFILVGGERSAERRNLLWGFRFVMDSVSRDIHGVAVRLKPHDALVIVSALSERDDASLRSLSSLRAKIKDGMALRMFM
jgi:hypothetical protein